LSDHNASADALARLVRRVVFEQAGAHDILPEEQGAAVGDEFCQQARGQRRPRDCEQKAR
jgi:hypothetical protein